MPFKMLYMVLLDGVLHKLHRQHSTFQQLFVYCASAPALGVPCSHCQTVTSQHVHGLLWGTVCITAHLISCFETSHHARL